MPQVQQTVLLLLSYPSTYMGPYGCSTVGPMPALGTLVHRWLLLAVLNAPSPIEVSALYCLSVLLISSPDKVFLPKQIQMYDVLIQVHLCSRTTLPQPK